MDFGTGFRISSSGMNAQKTRMNTISSNIANINTLRTAEGGPYRRKEVVLEALPEANSFGEMLLANPNQAMNRVQVTEVQHSKSDPIMQHEPDHPDADENGNVAYPNINLMMEMADMIQATRAYEANVSAMNATKDMAMSALSIGE